jgi:hypothetical protein
MRLALAAVLILSTQSLTACSRQDTLVAAQTAGQSSVVGHRDGVIRNWQGRISGDSRCRIFKDRLAAEGTRYGSAATGGFVMAMQRISTEAKVVNCVR